MNSEVEVNFTADHRSPKYEIILCEETDSDECTRFKLPIKVGVCVYLCNTS